MTTALTAYVQGATVLTADGANTFAQTTDLATDLRAFIGLTGLEVLVRGYAAIADGGEGAYWWNAADNSPDNATTVIVPTGAARPGAWNRLPDVSYTPPAIPAATFLGNDTGGAIAPIPLTGTEANTLLPAVVGDTGANTPLKGLVPAPANGDAAAFKALTADGAWTKVGFRGIPATDQSAAPYAVKAADVGEVQVFGGSCTLTIPLNIAGVIEGDIAEYAWRPGGVGAITPAGGVTLRWPAGGGATTARTVTGPARITLQAMGTNEWWIGGENIT